MRSYIVWRLASDIRPGDQERGKNRLQLLPWSVFCVWAFSFWPDPLEDDEEKYQSKWNQDRYVSFRWENGARVIVVEKSKMKKNHKEPCLDLIWWFDTNDYYSTISSLVLAQRVLTSSFSKSQICWKIPSRWVFPTFFSVSSKKQKNLWGYSTKQSSLLWVVTLKWSLLCMYLHLRP